GLSGISHHAGSSGRIHVNASKAGLEGMVRGLAIELAPHNITANCIAPGSIDTVRGASAGGPHGRGMSREIPAGRQGRPEAFAAMTTKNLVQPQFGDVAGVLLEFAALDLFDDIDEPLIGARREPDLLALAHDKAVEEFDLDAAALCHVLAHRRALLGRAAGL